jgi:hypothetical protein
MASCINRTAGNWRLVDLRAAAESYRVVARQFIEPQAVRALEEIAAYYESLAIRAMSGGWHDESATGSPVVAFGQPDELRHAASLWR